VHVRLAQPVRARHLSTTLAVVAAIAVAGGAAACERATSSDDVTASWSVDPTSPVRGREMRAHVILLDGSGQPVRGARLQFEAHMAHPGMAPIIAAASEQDAGVYEARLAFTMPGSWTVVASGTLSDGRRLTRSFNVGDVR
jgi:hypothetical protein